MKKIEIVKFRASPEIRQTLDALAASEGTTPSEIMRRAIQFYDVVKAGGTETDRRRLFTNEFVFLVVDRYLAQTDQQTYDLLVAEADRRVRLLFERAQ